MSSTEQAAVKPRREPRESIRFRRNIPMTSYAIAKAIGESRITVARYLTEYGAKPVSTSGAGGKEYWPADYALARWGEGVLDQLVPGHVNGGRTNG